MWLKIITLILLMSHNSQASLVISSGLGLGNTTTQNEISQSEGPLTQMFTVEGLQHSKLVLGAEHLRSLNLSPLSTAISFTGIFFRSYINSAPSPYFKIDEVPADVFVTRDFSVFWGAGFGLTQSSLLPDENNQSSNAAGFYLSPRFGTELFLGKQIGIRSEIMMALTLMGKGTVNSFSILNSIFYKF